VTIDKWKYFKLDEFACPCGCGRHYDKMDHELIDFLDMMRGDYGYPIIINSGYRCPSYNTTIGGSMQSAHMRGMAADLHCPDSATRFWMVDYLIASEIKRIGIGSNFLHIDIDWRLPQGVIWTYS